MSNSGDFKPFVPADQNIPEITIWSVGLGVILAIILGAANAYLGLYAGTTVSASIPAAVISMGILRGLLKRGTILENNIVQTIAASGESLAAGVIFTIPAMLITGVWTDIEFWPTTLICICGGLLGIVFMVPLRRINVVEDKTLTFPEGVACAEVLESGEKAGSGAIYILWAIVVGATVKFLSAGFGIIKGTVEYATSVGKSAFYIGSDISPALLGVGYIVGLEVAIFAFMGGVVTWWVSLPILGLQSGVEGNALEWFWGSWSTKGRYLGVGAMMVGGVSSIWSVRKSIFKGFSEALVGYGQQYQEKKPIRTEENMSRNHLLAILIFTVILTFFLYQHLIQDVAISITATAAMLVMSFFFVAVASYVVGLVGSSNSPVSGMTITAVMLTAGLLYLFGMTGVKGIIATLGVAGVVCCAACSAGDISQDLKTGYLIGATPKKQQWMEIVGCIIPAFVMAPVLIMLHHSYGIATGQPGALKAPQATLFASLANGIFGNGNTPWDLILFGAGFGVLILIVNNALAARKSKLKISVMAIAVGMYLPLTLTFPMLLGGIVSYIAKNRSETGSGVLFASGLIAGEAIIGVLIGALIYINRTKTFNFPMTLLDSDVLSVLVLAALGGLLYWVSLKKKD